MRFGYNEACLDHETGVRHPETADRLRAIRQRLEHVHSAREKNPAPASRDRIEAVHDPVYVHEIKEFVVDGGGSWDADTVLSDGSWDAALASAGLAIWAAEGAVSLERRREIPFAIGRPPGHHATVDEAMGFCLFNNVAVAAQAAIDSGEAERVAIVDWDVHHGNGTQAIFYPRGDVFYASIHEKGLYPGTGRIDETGTGPGRGATLNIPLSSGAETSAHVNAVSRVVEPWLIAADPDLVLVSAGFDAHRHDPISRMAVSTEGFGLLTDQLLSIAGRTNARIGFVLEGGYGLDTLAEGVAMVHEVCAGYSPTSPSTELRDIDHERIEAVRSRHGLGS